LSIKNVEEGNKYYLEHQKTEAVSDQLLSRIIGVKKAYNGYSSEKNR
jgi:hypothetical protein